jgi:hypothetical protein
MIHTRLATMIILFAAAAGSAQAQTYGTPSGQRPPLYPYAGQSQQPYAVEVAPNTYVIHRPAKSRSYPYVTCIDCGRNPSAPTFERPRQPVDRGLIEELRQRNDARQTAATGEKIVREKPIVKETTRVVDDPPRVIERRHVVEDPPPAPRHPRAVVEAESKASKPHDGKPRVIRAEAEITILGPDRMSIRLTRKRGEPEAKALPGE